MTGQLPKGWRKHSLDSVASIQTGLAKGKAATEEMVNLPYLRVANVQDGYLDLNEIKYIEVKKTEIERYSLRPGDVLLTEGGDFDKLGRGTIWEGQINPCLHQNHVFVVRTNRDKLLPEFFSYQTASHYGKNYFIKCSKQSTNLASINSTQLKEYPVLMPDVNEQQGIVDCLSRIDVIIGLYANRLVSKKEQKKALAQRLLTGKQRFPEFAGEKWVEAKLDDVFSRVNRRNVEDHSNVVTISAQRGFVRQGDYFNKNIASETLENYFLMHKGEFAYNKSYSNGYPMGAIKRLNDFEKAVVTTLYICFNLKDTSTQDSDFWEQLFEWGTLNRGLMKVANEGGRAHGLLNVTPSDFFSLRVFIPSYREQQKIASALNAADYEVEVLTKKLDALKEQKKGLMQQLLTGKKRLKIEKQVAA